MTLQVITLGYCQLSGSFNLHTYSNNITIEGDSKELDVTVFGDSWEDKLLGLKSWTLKVDGFNDFTDDLVDEILWGYYNTGTGITLEVRPSSATVGVANPKYTGTVLPKTWTPLNAGVGDVSKSSISWPGTGALTRAVA